MLAETAYFYPTLIAYCAAYYLAAGLAINVGYHRCLTHRSFELWRPFKYLVVTLGLPAGTPVQWVGNHRFHHQNADADGDPHSPVRDGFWYAHAGWYIGTRSLPLCMLYSLAGPLRTIYDGGNRPRTNLAHNDLAREIQQDSYLSFVSRPVPFMLACWLHALLFFGIAYFLWYATGVAALWLTLVFIYNLGECIDSVAHLSGDKPYDDAMGNARNNAWLGIMTLGEGWHANHHAFPSSAKHGLLKGQFDAAWHMIRLLELLGIARDLRTPEQDAIGRKLNGAQYVGTN
jgi:stearoyl-CoA desaturase (delta-9 desaturase)